MKREAEARLLASGPAAPRPYGTTIDYRPVVHPSVAIERPQWPVPASRGGDGIRRGEGSP